MTSDAKVGLLLSFVFIIIIAFLINGLPDFFHSASIQQSLETSIDGFATGQSDLSSQAEAAIRSINNTESVKLPISLERPVENPTEVRFTRQLRPDVAASGTPTRKKPDSSKTDEGHIKTYVVGPGDNLALIAIKVYGDESGNKRAIVNRIFEANRSILDSPHEIAVGQKLSIPPLGPADEKKDNDGVVAAAGIFDKIKTFADKNLYALKVAVGKPAEYVVQPGDNLWNIADRFLADPSRYHEIVELNSNVIADAEDIQVGMRLKLPSR